MPMNLPETADRIRREANAFASFAHALLAHLNGGELTYRYVAAYSWIEFRLNGLPPWTVSADFLADLPATALDQAELHFRQAETYRRWTKALR